MPELPLFSFGADTTFCASVRLFSCGFGLFFSLAHQSSSSVANFHRMPKQICSSRVACFHVRFLRPSGGSCHCKHIRSSNILPRTHFRSIDASGKGSFVTTRMFFLKKNVLRCQFFSFLRCSNHNVVLTDGNAPSKPEYGEQLGNFFFLLLLLTSCQPARCLLANR